jgi:hypothetical protein
VTTHPSLYVLLPCSRSHRDIIEVSSRLFYDRQLLECANPSVTGSMMDWELLQPVVAPLYCRASTAKTEAKPCPLLFYGILGEHLHEVGAAPDSLSNGLPCAGQR